VSAKPLFRRVIEGTRTPGLRDHNLNLSSALSLLPEPKGPRPAVPPNRERPLVTAYAPARPLRHGPSADRGSRPAWSRTPSALRSSVARDRIGGRVGFEPQPPRLARPVPCQGVTR
jgi:hypothetical protein